MDWVALVIAVEWAGLAVIFGLGWLRAGNGHWRWKAGTIDPNAPIYGLLAFATLCSAVLYLIVFSTDPEAAAARFLSRTLGQQPLILALLAVAIIRKPWKQD